MIIYDIYDIYERLQALFFAVVSNFLFPSFSPPIKMPGTGNRTIEAVLHKKILYSGHGGAAAKLNRSFYLSVRLEFLPQTKERYSIFCGFCEGSTGMVPARASWVTSRRGPVSRTFT